MTAAKGSRPKFLKLRPLAIKRDGFKCVACGMTREKHFKKFKRDITVDHIDGNGRYSNTPNDTLENLQTLCLECHTRKDNILRNRKRNRIRISDWTAQVLAENKCSTIKWGDAHLLDQIAERANPKLMKEHFTDRWPRILHALQEDKRFKKFYAKHPTKNLLIRGFTFNAGESNGN